MKTNSLAAARRYLPLLLLLPALVLMAAGCNGSYGGGGGGGNTPYLSGLSVASGPVGTSVTISGSNFGATQGSSTVTFNGSAGTPTSWSDTSIVVPVPTGATTGPVVVTVGGKASNGVNFTVTSAAPSITGLSPTSGPVGTSVTITGSNFGSPQGSSTVTFNGTPAAPTSWSATSIVAPVPMGTPTGNGNVVVTVGGVASSGFNFTVTSAGPSISNLSPTSGPAGTSVTITGSNFGSSQGTSTVTFSGTAATPTSWSATSVVAPVPMGTPTGNGNVVVTVGGLASNGVTFTVGASPMGPLTKSTVNTRYFVTPAGNGVFLSGSHTWDDFQDTDQTSTPAAFPFTNFVNMLKSKGQNATILWRKDMPRECGWNSGTWNLLQQPWLRSTTAGASDGGNKFDLTQLNQPFFDRMHAEALTLQQNAIYAIVELFDALNVEAYRCGTNSPPSGDGYALTGANNINGVDDGYTSGTSGPGSFTMTTNNAVSNIEDAYVKKMLDTMNDLQNIVFQISEEQVGGAATFWIPHMIGLVKTYEKGGTWEGITYPGKPLQHLVGVGAFACSGDDVTLYATTADWVAPTITGCSASFPSNVATNNQGKIVINDSDHSLGYAAFVNSSTGAIDDANLRGYIWENVTNGASGLIFMDPYVVDWTSGMRNPCASPVNGICPSPMAKYDPFRTSMGFAQAFVNARMDLLKATPQGSLSSTGFCLADNAAAGAEYLVYAPSTGTSAVTFTVNLSATTKTLNVEWFNPATGVSTIPNPATIMGGSATQSFTAPFGGDAVLYLVDIAGHN